ncbi:MAG: orotidine-5'-phosphate decarboxylase [Bacteroidales bacterium]|nr:orotidine-5'-phosphate decarboxylase [Bacteroidales bacterium]
MNREGLFNLIKQKKSYLCVGLDSDIDKIPAHLKSADDPVFEFNKAIIDATLPYTVAYKPNLAFYECRGVEGWQSLEKTIKYLNQFSDQVFTIADAKRGDIGNTSKMYAKAFFENMNFDSITVSPYMGSDSIEPFLGFPNKWVIVLALTSNVGAQDFQLIKQSYGDTLENFGIRSLFRKKLYEKVISVSSGWGTTDNLMFVVGATQSEYMTSVRIWAPDHFLLVPGVGAQGGSLEEVAQFGMNDHCGLLVNSSRGIIFASKSTDFAQVAGQKAMELQQQMEATLITKGLL